LQYCATLAALPRLALAISVRTTVAAVGGGVTRAMISCFNQRDRFYSVIAIIGVPVLVLWPGNAAVAVVRSQCYTQAIIQSKFFPPQTFLYSASSRHGDTVGRRAEWWRTWLLPGFRPPHQQEHHPVAVSLVSPSRSWYRCSLIFLCCSVITGQFACP
jgi:hypothetical protein